MVKPVTQKFEEVIVNVEFDPSGAPGVYAPVCGMVDGTITRTANVDTDEVPGDCSDESVPLDVEVNVRSLEVAYSGAGKWSQQAHGDMMDWFYSGLPLVTRIQNVNASPGDTEFETGPAILVALNDGKTKGASVSRDIEIKFSGTPTRTAKA